MKVSVPVQSQVDLSHLGESCRRSVNRTLHGNTDSAEVSRKWGLQGGPWSSVTGVLTQRGEETQMYLWWWRRVWVTICKPRDKCQGEKRHRHTCDDGGGSGWLSSSQGTPHLASHTGSQKRWGMMLPGAFRGLGPCWHIDLRLPASRLWDRRVSCFRSPSLWALLWQPSETNKSTTNTLRKWIIEYRINSL